MDATLRNKWIKALESTKFRQDCGYLKQSINKHSHYCCLGVLRHIVDPKDTRSLNNKQQLLNHPQLKQFKLTKTQQHNLARLNDTPNTFKIIAQYIKEHL
jgi:hypothetical protein